MTPITDRSILATGGALPKTEIFAGINSAIEGLKPLVEAAFASPSSLRSSNIRMMPIHLEHVLNCLLNAARFHERGSHLFAHGYMRNAMETELRCMYRSGEGRDAVERDARKELQNIQRILSECVIGNFPSIEGKSGNMHLAFSGLEEAAQRTLVFIDILKDKTN